MDDVKSIADSLSEAQARVILQAQYGHMWRVWIVRPSRRRRFFEKLGLTHSGKRPFVRLTPLGAAVRQHLQDNAK